jgi:hypothetical protein
MAQWHDSLNQCRNLLKNLFDHFDPDLGRERRKDEGKNLALETPEFKSCDLVSCPT